MISKTEIQISKFKMAFLVLLMTGAMVACTSDFELAGSAWSNSYTGIDDDGDAYTATYTLVCNSESSGMLFLNISYADDEMPFCFAMPMTYTWDGSEGTAKATLKNPEVGSMTFSIPLSYSKETGLQATFTSIELLMEIGSPLELKKQNFAKPSTVNGTTWATSFSNYGENYNYELNFTSSTAAVLNLTMSEGFGDWETMNWNVNYSYSHGIGTTSITFDGETIEGGFYMPDNNTMLFSDGENGLLLTKKQ